MATNMAVTPLLDKSLRQILGTRPKWPGPSARGRSQGGTAKSRNCQFYLPSVGRQMKPEEIRLLTRALELIEELEANEPPQWATWDHSLWADQMVNGPRYMVGRWFGALCERDRVRYRRAID